MDEAFASVPTDTALLNELLHIFGFFTSFVWPSQLVPETK